MPDNMPIPAISQLVSIMAQLRDPVSGCAWDNKQSLASLARYTLEEAYEVVDAIERNDMQHLCAELGDLLLQIVFQSQIASEQNAFDFNDVAAAIATKMIERHPHIFGDEHEMDAVNIHMKWEERKAAERKIAGKTSLLADIPLALPAMIRAEKLQKRAGMVGFDWGNPRPVLDKISEEVAEFTRELDSGNQDKMIAELGDILFAVINLARLSGIDPEAALRQTNAKFERRFGYIENALGDLTAASLDEMEAQWQAAKKSVG